MNNRNTYRGENIEAALTARLIPPDARYPDCMCKIILTGRHLYVLEDNFNGSYETHFTFFTERILDLRSQQNGSDYNRSALGELMISGFLALFGGIIYVSGKRRDDDGIRFVITYKDDMGTCRQLYFKDLQSNANRFVKVFHKLKGL